MSRLAKMPILIPEGVTVTINEKVLSIKGKLGELKLNIHAYVTVVYEENKVKVSPIEGKAESDALSGTFFALISNMVVGVTEGFTKKLVLNGVGYRAAVKGNVVNLTLGFSHPVEHMLPEGITAMCPTQTEIVITGIDKQVVGQTAANIRAYRKPEPYKGKGIRYDNEHIRRKEAKKK